MSTNLSRTAQHRRAMWITFALTSIYLVMEVVGGYLTNSLALLADAAHMLTDVGGLGLALFASWLSQRPATPVKTYGYYRAEILAALANAVALLLISFYILYEAYQRFRAPPEVASIPMLGVAVLGIGVNLIGLWLLRGGAKESLNVQGAFLEVVSDTLGSVAVIVAALIMWITDWYYADPIFSALIGLFVLPRTWNLMRQAVNVLLEATPEHLNLNAIEQAMRQVEGVAGVHDLHVWTITSGLESLSAHVVVAEGFEPGATSQLLDALAARLKANFKIEHTTIQIELGSQRDEMTL
jgi:cobalt-zinc-cadmium efflux system protein